MDIAETQRHPIAGVLVSATDYDGATEAVISAALQRRFLGVTALAVHGVMTGYDDPEHRYRLNHLDLVVPDGQPVRWALNHLHDAGLSDRVYGPNLLLHVCGAAATHGLPIFLYGSTEEVLEPLAQNLTRRFPGLEVAGTRASSFGTVDPEEQAVIAAEIAASGARICMVGLGCPRQEVFVFEHRSLLDMPLLALGAAFDFHAGSVPQAPPWMQARGLEWLFRLTREPRRLWRRYLILNPRYLLAVRRQRSGHVVDGGSPPARPIGWA